MSPAGLSSCKPLIVCVGQNSKLAKQHSLPNQSSVAQVTRSAVIGATTKHNGKYDHQVMTSQQQPSGGRYIVPPVDLLTAHTYGLTSAAHT